MFYRSPTAMLKKGITGTIILHILVWMIILGLPVFAARRFQMGSNFLMTYYTLMAINALVFYINYLFLAPRLFFSKRKYLYVIAVPVLIFIFYFISDFTNLKVYEHISAKDREERLTQGNIEQPGRIHGERRIQKPPLGEMRPPRFFIAIPHAHAVGYTSSALFMVLLSLGLRLLERQSETEKMKEELDRANLRAELTFLKNQISPHFFFNTLNNIYSLIDRSTEDSKNAVIKLSRLMRYVLNESGQDYRFLSDEIEFMNNYIDLMKLRLSNKTRLNSNFPTDYKNLMIPHLLFVSLIENAFKYGISVQEDSFIDVSLRCEDDKIIFRCENGLPESNNGFILTSTGTGLENLKKRLQLLYPDRHTFDISKTRSKFEVKLIIWLK